MSVRLTVRGRFFSPQRVRQSLEGLSPDPGEGELFTPTQARSITHVPPLHVVVHIHTLNRIYPHRDTFAARTHPSRWRWELLALMWAGF